MKIVRESLNEVLLGVMKMDMYYKHKIEVYKNPASIKKLGPWCRAITDSKGNLFVASVEDEEQHTIATTHTEMISYLKKKGECLDMSWQGKLHGGVYVNGICWHRYENSSDFYLAESYSDNYVDGRTDPQTIKYVENFIDQARLKNPRINFILEKI